MTRSVCTLTLAAVLLLFSAAGAWAVKPRPGDYEAQPAMFPGVYQQGAFSVVNEGGQRRIVSSELLQGIFYPDVGKCGGFNLPLVAESIPISKSGKFSVRESTPVKRKSVLVVWKGRWVKRNKVVGTLKIKFKRCSSRIDWVGRRISEARQRPALTAPERKLEASERQPKTKPGDHLPRRRQLYLSLATKNVLISKSRRF